MGIPRVPNDAKLLIKEHQTLLQRLQNAESANQMCRQTIEDTAKRMASQVLLDILTEIPVDEINRDKRGIRISALKNYGYHNLADLQTASVHQLSIINGISDSMAYEIKRITDSLVEQAQKGVKIKLSIDNQTPAATALVKSISQYQKIQNISMACGKLLHQNRFSISQAITNLEPSLGGSQILNLLREVSVGFSHLRQKKKSVMKHINTC